MRSLVVFNLYCPRNDPERPERAEFKSNFNSLLAAQARTLISKGHHVILAGDMNISHKRIDNCDPDEQFEESIYRKWMDDLLNEQKEIHFVDMFRHFHPDEREQYTCWNSQKSARVTNYGTRIDYILADEGLKKFFKSCDIHPDIMGSDHCPVSAVLNVDVVSAERIPKKCTRFWPEFSGKQVSLRAFLKSSTGLAKDPGKKRSATLGRPSQSKLNAFFVSAKKPKIDDESKQETTKDTSKTIIVEQKAVVSRTATEMKSSWKTLLKGPPISPMCSGHNESCVMRVVKKEGPNKGKRFFCCARPDGAPDNKEARCSYFVWI